MRRAVLAAQNRGIKYIRLICLLGNRRMQAICRRMKGLLDYDDADVVCDIKVMAPTPVSFVEEAMDQDVAHSNLLLTHARMRRAGTKMH